MTTRTGQTEAEQTIKRLEDKRESFLEKEVRQLDALKGFEIIRIDEVRREFGHYLFVLFNPIRITPCGCKPDPFISDLNTYHSIYVYLVGDILKPYGRYCHHFNGQPTTESIQAIINRMMKIDPEHKDSDFLDQCEKRLEKRYNRVFRLGAA